jgi:hypothetical protein
MAPGSGSGPFTGQRLAASALSTTNPFRPPVQVFLPGLAVVSAFRVFGGCAFAAPDDFAVDDLAVDDFEPNDPAPALGFVLFGAGGV